MEGNITITKKEYFGLRKAEMEMSLLERGGVDNWEWYGESLNPDGEDEIDIKCKKLEKEIEAIK